MKLTADLMPSISALALLLSQPKNPPDSFLPSSFFFWASTSALRFSRLMSSIAPAARPLARLLPPPRMSPFHAFWRKSRTCSTIFKIPTPIITWPTTVRIVGSAARIAPPVRMFATMKPADVRAALSDADPGVRVEAERLLREIGGADPA